MSPLLQWARVCKPAALKIGVQLRPLLTQFAKFGMVGGVQLLIDWLLFVSMSWAGMPLVAANLIGRVGGATLGFWLNGKYTFSTDEKVVQLSRVQLFRFGLTWIMMSAISSALVWMVGHHAGLGWAWLAKPAGDAVLALMSFFISKHWIYR